MMVRLHEKRVVVVVEDLVGRFGAEAERHANGVQQREVVEDDL